MTCKATVTVLILAACTTLSGADHQTTVFRVPGPEEIYEAFQEGFIEYQEYRELLEISRADFLTPDDSVYLLQFPDLMAGFSSNPLFDAVDVVDTITAGDEITYHPWRQSLLIRQYQRLNHESQRRQLYRISGSNLGLTYYAETEEEYSGFRYWGRRFVQYQISSGPHHDNILAVGNYKTRFGLGLIYGYHGRLLAKSADRDDDEKFLFSNYGGGNGFLLTFSRTHEDINILYDTDRNETFSKHLIGLSVPFRIFLHHLQLSGIHGNLRNRKLDISLSMSLVSLFGNSGGKHIDTQWELAVAQIGGEYPYAAAMQLKWRNQRNSVNIIGWSYDSHYPGCFSGGPSSRRSRTLRFDEIDLSYSDRYSGETGVIIKASQPTHRIITFQSAAGYARRGFNDDRIEVRTGLRIMEGEKYGLKLDCYWRSDRLYSDIRNRRRVQLEIIRHHSGARTRMIVGRRFDNYANGDGFLLMGETSFKNQLGTWSILCKLDQLRIGDWKNRYLYLTGYYEMKIGGSLYSYIKYTYRYRRGEPQNSYGAVRLDFKWVIQ